jgi:hypothetical protein
MQPAGRQPSEAIDNGGSLLAVGGWRLAVGGWRLAPEPDLVVKATKAAHVIDLRYQSLPVSA